MRQDLTDITLLVDRSGSMSTIRDDAQGGINTFIKDQASQPGEALLSLVQFDTSYEFVHNGVPIKSVGEFVLTPRGGTALLDAIGRAINETGARLASMAEAVRPGLVVFVIMTDGEENSSKEFSRKKIAEMIQEQTEKYKWKFIYLGANQDAFKVGSEMAVATSGTAGFSSDKVGAAYACVSGKLGQMRTASATGDAAGVARAATFTPEERRSFS